MANPFDQFDQQKPTGGNPFDQFDPQKMGAAEDAARSLASGARSGVEMSLGTFGDVGAMQGQITEWLAKRFGASPETAGKIGSVAKWITPFPGAPSTEQVRAGTAAVAGDFLRHDPQTTVGEYAETIGEFLPVVAAGKGAIGKKLLTQVLAPAIGAETGGQLTEGSWIEPYARVAGGVAGALAPTMLRRAITPAPISPERRQMVEVLKREGVDLTAGQKTGRKSIGYMESQIGGAKTADIMDRQKEQFTGAALRKAGVNASRATPDAMDDAFDAIGKRFDNLAKNNRIVPDQKFVSDLRDAYSEYASVTGQSMRAPAVEKIIGDIAEEMRKGAISGDFYKTQVTKLRTLASGSARAPELSKALRGIRSALDDAMERSIAQTNPSDLGAWREARREYRNLMTVTDAVGGAGEDAAMGLISPSKLRGAAAKGGANKKAYVRGKGDYAELARAGEATMKPLPDSGTAGRLRAQNLGAGVATLLGGAAGGYAGDIPGMLAGAAAGTAVPYVAGRALMSRPVQGYLANQIMPGYRAIDPRAAALAAVLLAPRDRLSLVPPSN